MVLAHTGQYPPEPREGASAGLSQKAVGTMLHNQSEAVRFILYLKWLHWVARNRDRDREGWPATHTSPTTGGTGCAADREGQEDQAGHD